MKDFYYILGTERNCTPTELNSAYRKLAQKLQPAGQEPDHFLDDHFREVTEAYQILSDPAKRRKYDSACKKSYQRRGYYFKLSYLNIGVTLALILFTALFGMYVKKALNGDKSKPLAKVASVAAAKTKYHKKKRRTAKPLKATAHQSQVIKPVEIKPPVPVTKPVQSSVVRPAVVTVDKPAPVIAAKSQPIVTGKPIASPTIEKSASDVGYNNDPGSNYTSSLKANVTGVISLHETASYRSAVLVNIPDNSKVQVLEKGNGFYKIAFNNQIGYVPKWTIVSQ